MAVGAYACIEHVEMEIRPDAHINKFVCLGRKRMKIEMGESLIYSYMRHVKQCLIAQTNWKPSGNWIIPENIKENVIYEFDKINKHYAFTGVFKSNLDQTIKQAEIDVLGITNNNHVFAYEVAYHENGLQYGGKIETRERIIKKMLRTYLSLLLFFPNQQYEIAFCSPKVTPATERNINEYFEVLTNEFQTDRVKYKYYSNESFANEIYQKTIDNTMSEADTSELFIRSIKLHKISVDCANSNQNLNSPKMDMDNKQMVSSRETQSAYIPSNIKSVNINGKSIPINKGVSDKIQDFVKEIMHQLLDNNLLSEQDIILLLDTEYSKETFSLQYSLLRTIEQGRKDSNGYYRYWVDVFGKKYYVCNHWQLDYESIYMEKLQKWLLSLEK
jgi:hypothetical protein